MYLFEKYQLTPIVSIDPSLSSTGIYCSTGESYSIQTKNSKNKKIYNIAENIGRKISKLISLSTPPIILIEGYSYGKNTNNLTTLGEIKGAIIFVCKYYEVLIIEIPIQTWKSLLNYRHKKTTKEDRKNYIRQINILHQKKFNTTDEVDAYLIYIAALKILKIGPKTESQEKIYKQIEAYYEEIN